MIGNFLIYTNELDAWAKAEEEGRVQCPSGWDGSEVTKYITIPQRTDADTFALEVSDYQTLSEEETGNIVTEVLFRWEIEPDD